MTKKEILAHINAVAALLNENEKEQTNSLIAMQ
jgi:hypothetical protein